MDSIQSGKLLDAVVVVDVASEHPVVVDDDHAEGRAKILLRLRSIPFAYAIILADRAVEGDVSRSAGYQLNVKRSVVATRAPAPVEILIFRFLAQAPKIAFVE